MTIVVTIIGTAASIMVTTLFAYAICQQEVPGIEAFELYDGFYHAF